jgi:hypothetical protein
MLSSKKIQPACGVGKRKRRIHRATCRRLSLDLDMKELIVSDKKLTIVMMTQACKHKAFYFSKARCEPSAFFKMARLCYCSCDPLSIVAFEPQAHYGFEFGGS